MYQKLGYPLLCTFLIFVGSCGHTDVGSQITSIDSFLDDWHLAASNADENTYIGSMTEDGVFLGTDPTERWTTEQFAQFVHPYFSKGTGWTYKPKDRQIKVSDDGQTAWFDERLESANYGELRGTGVLEKIGGLWKLAHYSMTFPIPNDITVETITAVRKFAFKKPPIRPLPAGAYFGVNKSAWACSTCSRPKFAVVNGVFSTRQQVKDDLKNLKTVPLHAGYPLVIHTDQLSLADEKSEGVAIVLGLFDKKEDAKQWLGAYESMLPQAAIMDILDLDRAFERAEKKLAQSKQKKPSANLVVRIKTGGPVELLNLQQAKDTGYPKAAEPPCFVRSGDFFVIKENDLVDFYFNFAPVQCNGVPGVVPWKTTLLDAVITTDENGREIITQAVDSKEREITIERSYFDEHGRYNQEYFTNEPDGQ